MIEEVCSNWKNGRDEMKLYFKDSVSILLI